MAMIERAADTIKRFRQSALTENLGGVSVDDIMDYEGGNMDGPRMLDMFSKLLKSGGINQLQGHYGRVAKSLLDAGYLDPNGDILKDAPDIGEQGGEDIPYTVQTRDPQAKHNWVDQDEYDDWGEAERTAKELSKTAGDVRIVSKAVTHQGKTVEQPITTYSQGEEI